MNEYDRKNEDIDPMAASAEYELEKRVEKMDLIEVDLDKGSAFMMLVLLSLNVGDFSWFVTVIIIVKELFSVTSLQFK